MPIIFVNVSCVVDSVIADINQHYYSDDDVEIVYAKKVGTDFHM